MPTPPPQCAPGGPRRCKRLTACNSGRRKLAQQKLAQGQSPPVHAVSELPDASALAWPNTSSPTPAGEDGGWLLLGSDPRVSRFMAALERAYEDYTLGGPRPTDLYTVIRLNVMNAMFRNAEALGFPTHGLCADDYISPFNEHGPHTLTAAPVPLESCPAGLRPTAVQRRHPHHPWIDLFPFPRFRDNVVLAVEAGLLDEDELCLDLTETETVCMSEGNQPALIVWGDGSDGGGWEVNAAFVRRWGWLLRGCADMMAATNYWRAKRGEKRIVFDP